MFQSCACPVSLWYELAPYASCVRAITLADAFEIDGGCIVPSARADGTMALRSTSLCGAIDVLGADDIGGTARAAGAGVVVSGILQTSRDEPATDRRVTRGNEAVSAAALEAD